MKPPVHLEPPPMWTPEERPLVPGSPGTPDHPPGLRLAYAAVGLLVGITAGLGQALILANLPEVRDQFDLTPTQGAWLPAAYMMSNVTANLILFKARQQFGIIRFAEWSVLAYGFVVLWRLLADDYPAALLAQAACGIAAASLSVLGLFYILQAFPKVRMGAGLCIGMAATQIAVPMAWVVSPILLEISGLQGLHLFELGMALCSLAAVVVLKLPTSERIRAFEPIDAVTFVLLALAVALIVAVLAQMHVQWWLDQPWMAGALVLAALSIVVAGLIEHRRESPMIRTRWLGAAQMLRFAFGAISIRFLLAGQIYAATGLMFTLGMGPAQLQTLFLVIAAGTVCGAVLAALLSSPERLHAIIAASVLLIVIGSALGPEATNLTRPSDLYASQFLVACAAGMFLGPLVMLGVMPALSRGPEYVLTFSIVFSISQGLGGLLAPAIHGTIEQHRTQDHSAQILAHSVTETEVAMRSPPDETRDSEVKDGGTSSPEDRALLSRSEGDEGSVQALRDVVHLNTILAIAFLMWSLHRTMRVRQVAPSEPAPSNELPQVRPYERSSVPSLGSERSSPVDHAVTLDASKPAGDLPPSASPPVKP